MLFKTLDRQAWKQSGHNLDKMLREFPRALLEEAAAGRVALYLMDTDVEINDPWNRGIIARLYIGDLEQRLRQEIVLGLGGVEVLKTLGIDHYLLHLNEGHAAFALLGRIRAMVSAGQDFAAARFSARRMVKQYIKKFHSKSLEGALKD